MSELIMKTYGDWREFSFVTPSVWKSLPNDARLYKSKQLLSDT